MGFIMEMGDASIAQNGYPNLMLLILRLFSRTLAWWRTSRSALPSIEELDALWKDIGAPKDLNA